MVLVSHTYTLSLHKYGWYEKQEAAGSWFVEATRVFNHAHYAVGVFIVLSGFLLMMPLARAGTASFADGLKGFAYRRFRRIAPAYYAALLLFLSLTMAMYALKGPRDNGGDAGYAEATSVGSIVSHMLMVHNVHEDWIRGVCSPMWSVAAEVQIYALFALVLLPVLRWFGWGTALVLAIVIGYVPVLIPEQSEWQWPATQYVALFAFGMTGAMVVYARPDQKVLTALRDRAPWTMIALIAGVTALVILQLLPWRIAEHYQPPIDGLVGVATISLIMACTRTLSGQPASRLQAAPMSIVTFLSSRPMMVLASFSYSLYLLHKPILVRIANVLRGQGFSAPMVLLIELVVAIPLVMLFAWAFHLIFERPFIGHPTKTDDAVNLKPAWQRWLESRRLLPQWRRSQTA
jgi:peptidoglycan/LPS O-acetylase OafA/YrhL